MKKILLGLLIALPLMAYGQASNPNDTLKIGQGSSASDKGFIFDTNDGVSNKKLVIEKTSKLLKFDGNSVQIGDGALTADKSILFNGTSGKAFKYDFTNTEFSANDDLALDAGKSLKTNSINTKSGTTTDVEQNLRVKGTQFIGTGNNQIRVSGGNLEFSNDGSLYKKIGSGSGGGAAGVNLLSSQNDSFEDGLTPGWTSSGGTFSQQTYSNGLEGDTKYARLVSTVIGDYFETTAIAIPDSLGRGCMVDMKFLITSGSWLVTVIDGSANILISKALTDPSNPAQQWFQMPTESFRCPDAGVTVKLRVASTATGTIQADKGYLGGNKNTVSVPCQGTVECEDTFSAKVSSTDVVSEENIDWINGNCTDAATGYSTCTFKTGVFTVAPNCGFTPGTAGLSGGVIAGLSSTSVTFRSINTAGAYTNSDINIWCQKAGIDYTKAKPQTAVTSEQSGWFIDAVIGGANPSLGTSALTSYTGITDAGLDMVLNPGSASARIPCSSTNTSTGLTCAVGTEQLGVNIPSLPYSGYFDVCFYFGHEANLNSSSGLYATFQSVLTQNNAQTITTEGGQRFTAGGQMGSGSSGVKATPVVSCGTYLFTDTSEKTIRLMYELQVIGTPSAHIVYADRSAVNGQRDVRVTVRPSTMNIARPVLTGDQMTVDGSINPVSGGAIIAAGTESTLCSTTGACTLYRSKGNVISGASKTATTGQYTITLDAAKINTSTALCRSVHMASGLSNHTCTAGNIISGSMAVYCQNANTNAAANLLFQVFCEGEKP